MIDNRSDVIRMLKRYCEGKDKIDVAKVSVLNIHRMIKALEQEQKWIPCSERMPEEVGTYMTTVDYGVDGLVTGKRCYRGKHAGWNDDCVAAWMPLPEPYKAESEE